MAARTVSNMAPPGGRGAPPGGDEPPGGRGAPPGGRPPRISVGRQGRGLRFGRSAAPRVRLPGGGFGQPGQKVVTKTTVKDRRSLLRQELAKYRKGRTDLSSASTGAQAGYTPRLNLGNKYPKPRAKVSQAGAQAGAAAAGTGAPPPPQAASGAGTPPPTKPKAPKKPKAAPAAAAAPPPPTPAPKAPPQKPPTIPKAKKMPGSVRATRNALAQKRAQNFATGRGQGLAGKTGAGNAPLAVRTYKQGDPVPPGYIVLPGGEMITEEENERRQEALASHQSMLANIHQQLGHGNALGSPGHTSTLGLPAPKSNPGTGGGNP
jgi:hypothetical protein